MNHNRPFEYKLIQAMKILEILEYLQVTTPTNYLELHQKLIWQRDELQT